MTVKFSDQGFGYPNGPTQMNLRLKLAGTKAVSTNHPEYAAKAAEAIESLARPTSRNGEWLNPADFTAEDVRKIAGDPPAPNCLGAALSQATQRGDIVAVGWQESTRTAARGRPLRVWRGRAS